MIIFFKKKQLNFYSNNYFSKILITKCNELIFKTL